jgi:hypothetical protein
MEEEAGIGAEATDPTVSDAEMMERMQEEIRNLPVSDHLLYMMHSLSALAVARLGVTAETVAHRDLEQARSAIDGFKALMEVVERARPAGETVIHRGTLSQLQLAYVEALGADAKRTADEAAEVPEGTGEPSE